jgi:hypothetical protein
LVFLFMRVCVCRLRRSEDAALRRKRQYARYNNSTE